MKKGVTVAIIKPDVVAAGKVDEIIEEVRYNCFLLQIYLIWLSEIDLRKEKKQLNKKGNRS